MASQRLSKDRSATQPSQSGGVSSSPQPEKAAQQPTKENDEPKLSENSKKMQESSDLNTNLAKFSKITEEKPSIKIENEIMIGITMASESRYKFKINSKMSKKI